MESLISAYNVNCLPLRERERGRRRGGFKLREVNFKWVGVRWFHSLDCSRESGRRLNERRTRAPITAVHVTTAQEPLSKALNHAEVWHKKELVGCRQRDLQHQDLASVIQSRYRHPPRQRYGYNIIHFLNKHHIFPYSGAFLVSNQIVWTCSAESWFK